MNQHVTETNFEQLVYDFGMALYGDSAALDYKRCPFPLDFGNELHSQKQLITWFLYVWKSPKTKTTIFEEFVAKYVKDPKLAAKILQVCQMFYGDFSLVRTTTRKIVINDDIFGTRSFDAVVVKSNTTKKQYKLMITSQSAANLDSCNSFTGLIHPWLKDGTHKTFGIISFKVPLSD